MQVIGHHDPFVQCYVWMMGGQPLPMLGHNLPKFVHLHRPIHNRAKCLFLLMGAEGDEINICCRIIVPFKANGSTVMFVGIVCHGKWGFALYSYHSLVVGVGCRSVMIVVRYGSGGDMVVDWVAMLLVGRVAITIVGWVATLVGRGGSRTAPTGYIGQYQNPISGLGMTIHWFHSTHYLDG
jgi:hypothetical protein